LLHQAGHLGGTASRLTRTFQGQLFHHRLASTGSCGPTMHRVPVYPVELRAFAHSLIPKSRFTAHLTCQPPCRRRCRAEQPCWRAPSRRATLRTGSQSAIASYTVSPMPITVAWLLLVERLLAEARTPYQ